MLDLRLQAKYPVSPRFSKMLCLARHYDCLQHVVAIVSALTVKELFARDAAVDLAEFEEDPEKLEQKKRHGAAMHQWKLEGIAKGGDLGATLCAVGVCISILLFLFMGQIFLIHFHFS